MKKLLLVFAAWLLTFGALAERTTELRAYNDKRGVFLISFAFDDSAANYPATYPSYAHYDADIFVTKTGETNVVDFKGVFTYGKCYEDNLSNIVTRALETGKLAKYIYVTNIICLTDTVTNMAVFKKIEAIGTVPLTIGFKTNLLRAIKLASSGETYSYEIEQEIVPIVTNLPVRVYEDGTLRIVK